MYAVYEIANRTFMPLTEWLTAHALHGRLCDFQNFQEFGIFRQPKFFVDFLVSQNRFVQ